MTNERNPENNLLENRQFEAALAQMSETELARLLHNVQALDADLDRLVFPDSGPISVVTDTQSLLKIFIGKVSRALSLRQVKDTYDDLHNWDNEGGTVHHAAPGRVLSRMVDGERRLVWADAEGVGER
jgi:hypothetical protein